MLSLRSAYQIRHLGWNKVWILTTLGPICILMFVRRECSCSTCEVFFFTLPLYPPGSDVCVWRWTVVQLAWLSRSWLSVDDNLATLGWVAIRAVDCCWNLWYALGVCLQLEALYEWPIVSLVKRWGLVLVEQGVACCWVREICCCTEESLQWFWVCGSGILFVYRFSLSISLSSIGSRQVAQALSGDWLLIGVHLLEGLVTFDSVFPLLVGFLTGGLFKMQVASSRVFCYRCAIGAQSPPWCRSFFIILQK